ncbi:MAG: 16S rRNA (cytosine(1402)-N(4))-methyltransferase, partial [Variovorax sp.]
MDPSWTHTTVLLNEAVDALFPEPAVPARGNFVDATFGRGGHARAILARLAPEGRLIAFDKDVEAVAEAARITDARFSIRHQGFRDLGELPPASVA